MGNGEMNGMSGGPLQEIVKALWKAKIPDIVKVAVFSAIVGGAGVWVYISITNTRTDDLKYMHDQFTALHSEVNSDREADSLRLFIYDQGSTKRLAKINHKLARLYGQHGWVYEDIDK